MLIRQYESVVLLNAALEDEQIEETLKGVVETINANGGNIIDSDIWGRKRLAYPIQKSKSAFYAVYRFTAPSDLIAKLERFYSLDENIIRHLNILLDKKAIKFYDEMKAKKENEKDSESLEAESKSDKAEKES